MFAETGSAPQVQTSFTGESYLFGKAIKQYLNCTDWLTDMQDLAKYTGQRSNTALNFGAIEYMFPALNYSVL